MRRYRSSDRPCDPGLFCWGPRAAKPLAELVGYGTSADAYHLTAGPEDGSGARRAMEQALRQAAVSPADVQHINAHATSTPVGDKGELAAIR